MSELQVISDSINKLDQWITKNEWKAYDPFDGFNAKVLSTLTFNNHYLKIVLQQSVRRLPINLRPILGIKKETSSKGMGFCALGYLKLYQAIQQEEFLQKMKFCLDWLIRNYSKGYSGYAWGNHFNYESRGGNIPLNVPTIVWTSLVAHAFFDAYEEFKEPAYFDIAKSACDFIVHDIGCYKDSEETICFMYTPENKNNPTAEGCIHNSNVLGAWLLSRLYKHTKDRGLLSLAKKSINYTLRYQLPSGGWYYGEPQKYRWEDNFHTGYNLESIYGYIKATGDKTNTQTHTHTRKRYFTHTHISHTHTHTSHTHTSNTHTPSHTHTRHTHIHITHTHIPHTHITHTHHTHTSHTHAHTYILSVGKSQEQHRIHV